MDTDAKKVEILSLATAATTERTKIRLNTIKFDTALYCHRTDGALSPEGLVSLTDSLTLEGMQVPIEVFVDDQGNNVLLKGHRRVSACRALACKNVPGFALDMEVEAIVVKDATPADRLLRSILDNEVRLSLDRVSRIRMAKKLHDAGVPVERAARAMGVSVKTYERDLMIAKYAWLFQHVMDVSISATHAIALLEAAEKAGRVEVMRADLDAWIAGKKRGLREKEKLRKARDGKEFSPAEKQVKKLLANHMVAHWVDLLRDGKRFDEDARWNFAAGIEEETEQLKISPVILDLSKAPLDQLAKVASKLSKVANQLVPYIQKAQRAESGEGDGEPDVAESPYDLDFLRKLGLESYADELEAQTRKESEPDGEESLPYGMTRETADIIEKVLLGGSGDSQDEEAPAAIPPSDPLAESDEALVESAVAQAEPEEAVGEPEAMAPAAPAPAIQRVPAAPTNPAIQRVPAAPTAQKPAIRKGAKK